MDGRVKRVSDAPPPDVPLDGTTATRRRLPAHLPRVRSPPQVLEAGGVAPLVRLLKNRDDKKVTLNLNLNAWTRR